MVDIFRRCLNSLLTRFSGFKNSVEPVDDTEEVTRFIFERGHVRSSDGSVKHNALLPPHNNLKTSVFRTTKMSAEEVERTKVDVEKIRQKKDSSKKLQAESVAHVTDVRKLGLEVEPEESDFKWHADIVDWPEEKQKRMALAKELARQMRTTRF